MKAICLTLLFALCLTSVLSTLTQRKLEKVNNIKRSLIEVSINNLSPTQFRSLIMGTKTQKLRVLRKLGKEIGLPKRILNNTPRLMGFFDDLIDTVTKPFEELGKLIEVGVNELGHAITGAVNDAGRVFEHVGRWTEDAAGDLVDEAGNVFRSIGSFGLGVGNTINCTFSKVGNSGKNVVKAVGDYVNNVPWDQVKDTLVDVAKKGAGTLAGVIVNVGGTYLVTMGCAAATVGTANPIVGLACETAGTWVVGELADLTKRQIDIQLNGHEIDNVYTNVVMAAGGAINFSQITRQGIKILSKEGAKAVAKQAAKGVGKYALKEMAKKNFGGGLTRRALRRALKQEWKEFDRKLENGELDL